MFVSLYSIRAQDRVAVCRAAVSTSSSCSRLSTGSAGCRSRVSSHHAGDVREAQPALQEALHRHLVRAHSTAVAVPPARPASRARPQAGEALRVGRLEPQLSHRGEVEGAALGVRAGEALPAGEGQLDGQLHVRPAQLGLERAVDELHQGVHDALGVHHHLDALVGEVEQPVGLDRLQPLVHQGGAVHRDLGPHAPVGVGQGLGHVDPLHLLRREGAEGAPGGGQEHPPHRARPLLPAEALPEGAVLAVHREQAGPGAARRAPSPGPRR